MSKPRTEAVRVLLGQIAYNDDPHEYLPGDIPWGWEEKYGEFIEAVQAEARAAVLRELRAKVERLSPMGRDDYLITALDGTTRRPTTPADWVESYRVTVLAAIDEMLPDGLLVTRKDLNEHDYPGDTRQFDTHQRKEADHE